MLFKRETDIILLKLVKESLPSKLLMDLTSIYLMKRKFFSIVLLSLLALQVIAQKADERYFDINKNIEIFNSVVKELDMFYVDSVDIDKTVQTGIINMLAGLDPYTTYYGEQEMDDFKFMTTGEYAGIGSYITARKIGGVYRIIISGPYEGMPAAKAGLRDGDIILSVDDMDMTKLDGAEATTSEQGNRLSTQVSNNLKGQPGTTAKIKIQRPGEKKPREFKVIREKIQIGSVPYYGILENNTGYIAYTGFTDKSALEVKNAFLDLKKQGITSLILDLRSNGGGILEEAVQVVNYFVPKGEIVLSTKGKIKQTERVYRTTLAPIDTEIPLAVLVDRASASAAEIVSGALQDKDRAVIIGERTYGKGLVQMSRGLPYGGSMKITTSKYYIPSGRCIQAIDYAHHNEDGSVERIPDSLTHVFKTVNGREVRDGGGIIPDIAVKAEKTPNLAFYLATQFIIFDFVTDWVSKHKEIAPAHEFSITDKDYDEFKNYVKAQKDFKYDMLSEKTLNSLKEMMEFEGYMTTASDEFKALSEKLTPNLDRDLDTFKPYISGLLNMEIAKRYYYKKGEIIEDLKNSKEVEEALKVLNDNNRYKEILSPVSPTANDNAIAAAQ